jgi:hypothetical protein
MYALTLLTLVCIALAGHPRCAVRERASAGLARLVQECPAVVMAGEKHADPEIAQRCTFAVDRWCREHADELSRRVFPGGWATLPWLAFGDEDAAWQYIREAGGIERWNHDAWMGFWSVRDFNGTQQRAATRLWIVGRIATRQPYQALLDAMATAESHAQPERLDMPVGQEESACRRWAGRELPGTCCQRFPISAGLFASHSSTIAQHP